MAGHRQLEVIAPYMTHLSGRPSLHRLESPGTLEAIADNVKGEEEAVEILCAPDTFNELKDTASAA